MVASTLIETRSRVWSPVLEDLRSDLLDCIQANLAAVADKHYGAGSYLALGAALGFSITDGPLRMPVVAAGLEERLPEAAELLGLNVAERWDGVDGAQLRELSEERGPLFVVSDAYTLGWVPYAGQAHMEHSFLLIGTGPSCLVADAYRNATQWGQATPGVWRLAREQLDEAVPRATAMVIEARGAPSLSPAAALGANERAMCEAVPAIDAYVHAVRCHAEEPDIMAQVVLDIWLLGRSRGLHAAWLATADEVSQDASSAAGRQAEAWLNLAAQSYVAMRRAKRGGGFPSAVIDRLAGLLHDDVVLARRLSEEGCRPAPATEAPQVRAVVIEQLRAVMQEDAVVGGGRPLRDLPNFNSFRLVEVIEQVEARLGIEVDPDELTADSLRDIDSLCGLFVRANARKKALQP